MTNFTISEDITKGDTPFVRFLEKKRVYCTLKQNILIDDFLEYKNFRRFATELKIGEVPLGR